MKIRNSGYVNPYSGVSSASPAAPAAPSEGARPASAAGVQPVDQATILGIPETELTPKVKGAIEKLLFEVQRLREELEQAKRRMSHLEELADRDTLTPVLNRRAFVRELSRVMSFAERYGATSAVIYFDVNNLKQINDSYGHAAGDAALTHVASVLTSNIRESDIVGRLGGDEFGVILVQADPTEAQTKATLLGEAIVARPLLWDDVSLQVGASFGMQILTPGQEALEAIEAADREMYRQKRENPDARGSGKQPPEQ